MKSLFAVIVCFEASILAACGHNAIYIDLAYPPTKVPKVEKFKKEPSASTDRKQGPVLVVDDKRSSVDRIGELLNEFGPESSVLTENNVAIWMHDAIVHELHSLGYEVFERGDPEGGSSSETLTVEIKEINCIISGFYECKVLLQAVLEEHGGQLIRGDYPGEANAGLRWTVNEKKATESLARALRKSVRMMLYDFGYKSRSAAEPAALSK